MELTQDFLKQFGVFVGFYNKVNNTSFTVKQALQNETLMGFYGKVAQATQLVNGRIGGPTKKSTKREAYDRLNVPELDSHVLEYINNNQDRSRQEIAKDMSLPINTVCGAVKRLIDAKMIFVSKVGTNPDSNRSVELLGSVTLVY